MSDRSSPASADSTSDSPELGFDTSSSVSLILGAAPSSRPTGPEFRSSRTFVKLRRAGDPRWPESWKESGLAPTVDGWGQGPRTATLVTSSAEASPARTYPSPDAERDLPVSAPDSSSSSPESLSLFDLAGYSLRTFPDCSPRTAVGTSESCLERWPTSGTAWAGGLSTAATSECRSDEGGCSSSEPLLREILEEAQSVPAKYSLSARAASGILRRASKRGRQLPEHLADALRAASTTKDQHSA